MKFQQIKLSKFQRIVASAMATVAAAVVICEASGWPFLRAPLETALTDWARVPVQVRDDFKLRLFLDPRLHAGQLIVGAANGFTQPHLLNATDVRLDLQWKDVFNAAMGKSIIVESISARSLNILATRNASGLASWDIGPPTKAGNVRSPPIFRRIAVADGRISINDATTQTSVDIAIAGQEITQTLSKSDVENANAAERPSGFTASAKGKVRDFKVVAKASGSSVMHLFSQGEADNTDAPSLDVDIQFGGTHLIFNGRAASLLDGNQLSGNFLIKGSSLQASAAPLGVVLPNTPKFSIQGKLTHQSGIWNVMVDKGRIGSSQLNATLQYDTLKNPPLLSGKLGGSRLAFADLGPAVGTDVAPRRVGRVLPDSKFNIPGMSVMQADVQVSIDTMDFNTKSIAPMKNVSTHLMLQKSKLLMKDLQATVAGGTVKGSTELDAKEAVPAWRASLDFNGVDLAGWIRVLSKDGKAETGTRAKPQQTAKSTSLRKNRQAAMSTTSEPKSFMTGLVFAHLELVSQGSSVAEILGRANGSLKTEVKEGTLSHLVTEIAGIDLAQGLGVYLRGDQTLVLTCARVSGKIVNGIFTPAEALIVNKDSVLRVTGLVDMNQEALKLTLRAMPKDASLFSLQTPIVVSGSFAKPSVGLDNKSLMGRVLASIALGAVAGPAAAIPFVQLPSDNGKGDPCQSIS